eukprot:XP_016658844.1 PREDICTED: uncharacterized protein LOC100164274 [Acyrthosiphon pisum]
MTFWNSIFCKSQVVLSAMKKVPSILEKNTLQHKKCLELRNLKDNYLNPYGYMPRKMQSKTSLKDEILKVMDNLEIKGGSTDAAIENDGSGVDNTSRTELFRLASLYNGPERNLVNFPRMVKSEDSPKTSYLSVFKEWFELFSKKTGFTEPFRVAPLCASAVCTTETKPAVAETNKSIIVAGFPKPNGLPQPNPFNGPERDLVNFPRMVRLEDPPKTRYLFVPEEWFEVFYEKTGVTGPYVLAAGITTFLLSKEIWVVDHEFPYVLATIGLFYVGWKKFGASLASSIDREIDEYEASCNSSRIGEIDSLRKTVEHQKIEVWRTEAQAQIIRAKRENVAIQLEAAYGGRLIPSFERTTR